MEKFKRLDLARNGWVQTDTSKYAQELYMFFNESHIGHFFHRPVDHLALKAADANQFDNWLEDILSTSTKLSFIISDSRRLATARTKDPIFFPGLGIIKTLEIMEPRPERVGLDLVGLDHIELLRPLDAIEFHFRMYALPFKTQENESHKTLVLQINKEGQEVKFTEKRLLDIVQDEILSGQATILK